MVNIHTNKEALLAVDKDTTTTAPSNAAATSAELFDPTTAHLAAAFIESKFARLQPSCGDEPDPIGTNDEKAIAREKTLNARHVFFLQHVIGLLQARLASDAVLQSLTPLFPDSNAAVLSLLPGTVRGPKSQDTSPTRKLFWIS
ncbi:hypothetical protein EYZ11_008036 [Aspergillus tanneri]|uniref:Uncharacterized protein n=1 Tax=Aspergillus tanneri TaxID=1220188 RepID=A0A4S3JDP9_9EURO|nr:hypothetical protein EYZ11_008036 [Aspergillus tanneri]